MNFLPLDGVVTDGFSTIDTSITAAKTMNGV